MTNASCRSQEIRRHLGKRLGPLGADLVPGVVDEHQMAVRQQRLVDAAHLRRDHPVQRAEQHQRRRRQSRIRASSSRIAIGPAQPPDQRALLRLRSPDRAPASAPAARDGRRSGARSPPACPTAAGALPGGSPPAPPAPAPARDPAAAAPATAPRVPPNEVAIRLNRSMPSAPPPPPSWRRARAQRLRPRVLGRRAEAWHLEHDHPVAAGSAGRAPRVMRMPPAPCRCTSGVPCPASM